MTTVLHVIPTLEGGGAERQLAMLSEEMVRRRWQVHIAVRRGGIHVERVHRAGVVVHQLGDLRSVHPLLVARLGSLVRRIQPAVIQTWLPQMDVVGGIVARWSSVPWVLSERASGATYQARGARRWLRLRLARHARAVVANSALGAGYWAEQLGPTATVHTIPNAVEVDLIRRAAPIECAPAGAATRVLLYVGRLSDEKAPEVFVEAIRRVPRDQGVLGVLLGDGPMRDQLQNSIEKGALEQRVMMLAYQPSWWGMMKTATAIVNPSRFEGHPNTVLEAMAAGCPLIVSEIPAHREILDERSAMFVPAGDPGSLAGAIAALCADPEAARERASRASELVTGNTIERTADAYQRVYEHILERRAA